MDTSFNLVLGISGLLCGASLGFIIQRSRFCMTAIVSNYVLLRDTRQFHTYMIAILIAIMGVFFLDYTGTVSINNSVYLRSDIHLLSSILGGLLFGIGAVMAGGCIGRILSLTGEGNLGALLALLTISLGATTVYTGALEPLRIWIYNIAVIDTDETSILTLTQLPVWQFILILLLMSSVAIYICCRNKLDRSFVFAGIGIGLLVITGWWVTGSLTVDEFSNQRPSSLTFSGPLVNASLYVTVGNDPQNLFGVMLVTGVLLGSLISSVSSGHFHITTINSDSFMRIFNGGVFMGVGAILAGGCNIGQGLTGLSTLSIQSILVVICIFTGMYAGVKWLQYKETHSSIWPIIQKYFTHGLHFSH